MCDLLFNCQRHGNGRCITITVSRDRGEGDSSFASVNKTKSLPANPYAVRAAQTIATPICRTHAAGFTISRERRADCRGIEQGESAVKQDAPHDDEALSSRDTARFDLAARRAERGGPCVSHLRQLRTFFSELSPTVFLRACADSSRSMRIVRGATKPKRT